MIFAFTDLSQLTVYLKQMAGIGTAGLAGSQALYLLATSLVTLLIAAVASTPIIRILYLKTAEKCRPLALALMIVTLILSVACLVCQSYNPFLYFRF